jgi:hypothetical protein
VGLNGSTVRAAKTPPLTPELLGVPGSRNVGGADGVGVDDGLDPLPERADGMVERARRGVNRAMLCRSTVRLSAGLTGVQVGTSMRATQADRYEQPRDGAREERRELALTSSGEKPNWVR